MAVLNTYTKGDRVTTMTFKYSYTVFGGRYRFYVGRRKPLPPSKKLTEAQRAGRAFSDNLYHWRKERADA